jgi:hypothetical protein
MSQSNGSHTLADNFEARNHELPFTTARDYKNQKKKGG